MKPEIEVAANADDLADRAAAHIAARIAAAPRRFALNLSGGSTPENVYRRLGAEPLRSAIDWRKTHIFFGDERFVHPDHQDSNYRMAAEALFHKSPIPPDQVHRIETDASSPEQAAAAYQRVLRAFYGRESLDPTRPLFDLTLLGLGTDGHTASLFPGVAALDERKDWVAAVRGATPQPRISLTFPALRSSAEILFLVSGPSKREVLARVLARDAALPAAQMMAAAAVRIIADRAALAA